jgi:Leucine-rich repeat (LRR) protein
MDKVNCAQITQKYTDLLRLRTDFFALAEGGWTRAKSKKGKTLEKDFHNKFNELRDLVSVEYVGQKMGYSEARVLKKIIYRLGQRWAPDKSIEDQGVQKEIKILEDAMAGRIECHAGKLISLDLAWLVGKAVDPEISALVNLKTLDLSQNAISEQTSPNLFDILRALPKLASLDLSRNLFNKQDKKVIKELENLKKRLGDNFIC